MPVSYTHLGASNGNARLNHSEISIPRFVLSGDYKLSDKWILGAEIEFESGGVGMAYEIESGSGAENGEYENEIEKGGEVALEQFQDVYKRQMEDSKESRSKSSMKEIY